MFQIAFLAGFDAAHAYAEVLENALFPEPVAVSVVDTERGPWRVEAIYDAMPPADALEELLTPVAQELGLSLPELVGAPVPERDWVSETLRGLAPVRAGRFTLYGSHDRGKVPARGIQFEIEASQAFGTGHHETTTGCLIALDDLAKAGARFDAIYDLGCGTGVLAMAAAKLWNVATLAGDIDPLAVRIARETIRANGLAHQVQAFTCAGFDHPAVRAAGPYDLVIANVLAKPLVQMAPEMARRVVPGGLVVLSGLLNTQARWVAGHYRMAGFRHRRHLIRGLWSTLVLERG